MEQSSGKVVCAVILHPLEYWWSLEEGAPQETQRAVPEKLGNPVDLKRTISNWLPALNTALFSSSYTLLPQMKPLWNNTNRTFWIYAEAHFVAFIGSAVFYLRYRKFQPKLGGLGYSTSWCSCHSFCLQRGLEQVANRHSSNLNYPAREVVPDSRLSPGLVQQKSCSEPATSAFFDLTWGGEGSPAAQRGKREMPSFCFAAV